MKNHGQYEIFLTGSRKNIRRNVYEDEYTGLLYIRFYGKDIEVIRGRFGYVTKELY